MREKEATHSCTRVYRSSNTVDRQCNHKWNKFVPGNFYKGICNNMKRTRKGRGGGGQRFLIHMFREATRQDTQVKAKRERMRFRSYSWIYDHRHSHYFIMTGLLSGSYIFPPSLFCAQVQRENLFNHRYMRNRFIIMAFYFIQPWYHIKDQQ